MSLRYNKKKSGRDKKKKKKKVNYNVFYFILSFFYFFKSLIAELMFFFQSFINLHVKTLSTKLLEKRPQRLKRKRLQTDLKVILKLKLIIFFIS